MDLLSKVFAQTGGTGGGTGGTGTTTGIFDIFTQPTNIDTANSWQSLVTKAIGVILAVAGALAVIYLIYSGILYITAAGNPDAAKKGQQGIINAIIGIIIIVAAYFIVGAVVNLGTGLTN